VTIARQVHADATGRGNVRGGWDITRKKQLGVLKSASRQSTSMPLQSSLGFPFAAANAVQQANVQVLIDL
jgi:hypothetical protein